MEVKVEYRVPVVKQSLGLCRILLVFIITVCLATRNKQFLFIILTY